MQKETDAHADASAPQVFAVHIANASTPQVSVSAHNSTSLNASSSALAEGWIENMEDFENVNISSANFSVPEPSVQNPDVLIPEVSSLEAAESHPVPLVVASLEPVPTAEPKPVVTRLSEAEYTAELNRLYYNKPIFDSFPALSPTYTREQVVILPESDA